MAMARHASNGRLLQLAAVSPALLSGALTRIRSTPLISLRRDPRGGRLPPHGVGLPGEAGGLALPPQCPSRGHPFPPEPPLPCLAAGAVLGGRTGWGGPWVPVGVLWGIAGGGCRVL